MIKLTSLIPITGLALALSVATLQAQELPPPSFTWSSTGFVASGGYSMGSGQIQRSITDIRVSGSVGERPLEWSRTMRNVNLFDPTIGAAGWCTAWTFSYHYSVYKAFLGDNTFADPVLRYPSGVAVTFTGGSAVLCSDRLVETTQPSGAPLWELQCADGTKVFFQTVGSTHGYAVRIVDAYGLETVITYDDINGANPRPVQINDASGRWIKVDHAGWASHVYSSDGQDVWYQWDPSGGLGSRLLKAVYSDGSEASYSYNANLPAVARDTRCDSSVNNIKYEFSIGLPSNPFNSAFIQYVKEADSGVTISERIWGNPMLERRGDGATRKLGISGLAFQMAYEEDYLGNRQSYTYHPTGALASLTDAYNRVTGYQREAQFGLPTSITYADSTTESFEYIGTHPLFLKRRTDVRGNVTNYDLFSNGLIGQANYPDASNETWTYNGLNRPLTHRLRNGATESWSYDSAGRLLTHWLPSYDDQHAAVSYDYYPDGHPWEDRLKTTTDQRGNVTTFEYDLKFVYGVQTTEACPGRGLLTKITNPDGTYKSFGYDIYGNKIWAEDESRNRTAFTYDCYNRLRTTTDWLGRVAEIRYGDTDAEALAQTDRLPKRVISPAGRLTSLFYDANRRLTLKAEADGVPGVKYWRFEYDAVGNVTKQREQVGGSWAAEIWRDTTWSYDNRNRKITEYAPLGRNTDLGYDAAGNVIWVRHADGTCTSKDYDSMNRVAHSTDEMGRTTTYTYYPSGRAQYVIDPNGNAYYYSYDAQDRPTYFYQTNADKSGFDYEQTNYDAAGNVIAFRNRSGAWKALQYDNRNREIATSWSDGFTPATSTSYYPTSLVLQRSNSSSTLAYTYDRAGQLTVERQAISGAPPKTITYEYDLDGNRTRMRVRTN